MAKVFEDGLKILIAHREKKDIEPNDELLASMKAAYIIEKAKTRQKTHCTPTQ